jgi:hypothetical protein
MEEEDRFSGTVFIYEYLLSRLRERGAGVLCRKAAYNFEHTLQESS